MVLHRYDAHVETTDILYVTNRKLAIILPELWFDHFDLNLCASSNKNHAMIVIMNEYFWHLCITRNEKHMTLYHTDIFLSLGNIIEHSVESLMVILLSAYLASLGPTYSGVLVMLL